MVSQCDAKLVSSQEKLQASFTGRCSSSYGELLQGVLPDGQHFLVTIPINLFSEVVFVQSSGSTLQVLPSSKKKTGLFLEKLSQEFNLQLSGVATVSSEIPVGKGLSSSTSDIIASLRAVENFVGYEFPKERIQKILREIEPSDGLLYSESVVYDHINSILIDKLGRIHPVYILSIDEGGVLDTVVYNRNPKIFSEQDRLIYANLLQEMVTAFQQKNIERIGEIATQSAVLNQKFNFKRTLPLAINLCEKLGGYGIVNTHSGTCLGILIDREKDLASGLLDGAKELFPTEKITLYQSI